MKTAFLILSLLFAGITEAAYSIKPGKRSPSAIDRLPFHSVADMKRIPQKTSYYAKQLQPLSWKQQKKYDRAYNKRYFAPWKMQKADDQ